MADGAFSSQIDPAQMAAFRGERNSAAGLVSVRRRLMLEFRFLGPG
jgi:hypothetical protein